MSKMGDFTHIFECLIGTSVGTFVGTLLVLQENSNENGVKNAKKCPKTAIFSGLEHSGRGTKSFARLDFLAKCC